MKRQASMLVLALALGACTNAPVQPPGEGHLRAEKVSPGDTANIPAPVQQIVSLPKPKPAPKVETYSVVVNNVKVQELLFALARDAKLNVDIHPGIDGTVTLNAIDQTLQQLLARIAKQVDIRWELNGPNLAVMPDAPFLRTYKVDYVNMSRDVTSTVAINTQIASTSTAATSSSGASTTSGGGNNSSTTVTSKAQNNFWESLHTSLVGILNEKDRTKWEVKCQEEAKASAAATLASTGTGQSTTITPALGPATTTTGPGQNNAQGASTKSADSSKTCGQYIEKTEIIMNPDVGVVIVRATSRQHEKVQEYLDQVLASSRRQVMIEATIAEVSLSDQYQQGINWQRLRTNNSGFSMVQNPATPAFDATTAATGFLLNYLAPGVGIASTLKLLETFGNVKVLSSPKISVLNNQTAMLKVVDNIVYFTIKSDTTTNSSTTQTNVTATPHSVAVGLVMSVTPQVSENGLVFLNVRPTITSVKSADDRTQWVQDPTPNLGTQSYIPEIQTREMESMLRLVDGEIAVMGGANDRSNQQYDKCRTAPFSAPRHWHLLHIAQ
ncbi:MAG: secretin N-terminal domain-containing protein [Pseudomonadota bacterium]